MCSTPTRLILIILPPVTATVPVATLYLSFQCPFLDYTTRQWLGLSLLFWIVTKPVYPNHLVLELLCNFVQIVVKD